MCGGSECVGEGAAGVKVCMSGGVCGGDFVRLGVWLLMSFGGITSNEAFCSLFSNFYIFTMI